MNLVNGIGFYESLNKLIVGFLCLYLIVDMDNTYISNPLFYIGSFIIGCIYQALIRLLTMYWLTLNEKELKLAYSVEEKEMEIPSNIKDAYLTAYYRVAKAGLLMNVPIIEALENFMRNLVLIIFLYHTKVLFDYDLKNELFNNKPISALFLALLLIGVIILRCYYQYEVYRLIWEADQFLDRIENNKKKNNEE